MPAVAINLPAVIVATIVHQALGFLWYGPLFGKLWLRAMGKRMDELGNPTAAMATSTISALVMAFTLGLLVGLIGAIVGRSDLVSGAWIGLVTAVGFIATTQATAAAYQNANRTVSMLFIGYEVVAMVLMGAILGVWR